MSREKPDFLQLPLAKSPINYYLRFTMPLSIAFLDEEFYDYFQSTHLQMNVKKNGVALNIYSYQLPSVKIYLYIILTKKMNARKLLKQMISGVQHGLYCGVFLDWYYIPGMKTYEKEHFAHREYVYGYDMEKRELLVFGYTEEQHVKKYRLSFDDFIDAALYARKLRRAYELTFYKHSDRHPKMKFSFGAAYRGIKSYYKSTLPISVRWHAQKAHIFLRDRSTIGYSEHGMETHKYLAEALEDVFNGTGNPNVAGIKICGFLEFKQCMLQRMIYMRDNGYLTDIDDLIEEYAKIVHEYQVFKNMYLKYTITKNAEIVFRIMVGVENLIEPEYKIMGDLVERMKNRKRQ